LVCARAAVLLTTRVHTGVIAVVCTIIPAAIVITAPIVGAIAGRAITVVIATTTIVATIIAVVTIVGVRAITVIAHAVICAPITTAAVIARINA
jgi:hypothetical protein